MLHCFRMRTDRLLLRSPRLQLSEVFLRPRHVSCLFSQLHLFRAGAGGCRALPVWGRVLCDGHGVRSGAGLDEHALLHARSQTHRHLQHHDPEGNVTARETSCGNHSDILYSKRQSKWMVVGKFAAGSSGRSTNAKRIFFLSSSILNDSEKLSHQSHKGSLTV